MESADGALVESLLAWMQQHKLDFTNTFRDLASDRQLEKVIYQDAAFLNWRREWEQKLLDAGIMREDAIAKMHEANPTIIPRNHRVEEALRACEERDDVQVLERLLKAITDPFSEDADLQSYREPPPPAQRCYQTFCGT
jgi:uncharacterized protein YdiU (UPF0061 family)